VATSKGEKVKGRERWQKRVREGGKGERGEGGGKGRRGMGMGGKGRAPMTLWHGAPNVLIRPWISPSPKRPEAKYNGFETNG